jgi:hypothetical protein
MICSFNDRLINLDGKQVEQFGQQANTALRGIIESTTAAPDLRTIKR